MSPDVDSVMRELEALGTAHTKESYLARGARGPLFGVATGAMKPLKKQIGVNQVLAEELWDTGNYDAMYLAGMVADVRAMTEADFDRWMDGAYCAMLSDSGWRTDDYFERDHIRELLSLAAAAIHEASPRLKRAIHGFVVAVGVSYQPLHDEALKMADDMGPVGIVSSGGVKSVSSAAEQIRKAAERGRIGFKRRAVRC